MQRLDDTKREAILNAAKQRLGQYGVRKTTMQEIADDVGIAVGTLYLYFKNKNQILIAVAESYEQQHAVDTEKILRSPLPPPDKLKAYLRNRFRAVKDSRLSGSHAGELARVVLRLKPELQAEQNSIVKENVLLILQEGIEQQCFQIDDLAQDLEVFLYSLGYFFPMPTTEKFYEPEEENLVLVVNWFIQQWSTLSLFETTSEHPSKFRRISSKSAKTREKEKPMERQTTLQYLTPNTSITLREGIHELRQAEGSDNDALEQVAPELLQAIGMHDAIHVLFGCSTQLNSEISAHIWQVFGTTLTLAEMHRVNQHQDHRQVLARIGHGKLLRAWFRSIPHLIATVIRAMRMTQRWPAEDYEQFLDVPLVELRRQFNIHLPKPKDGKTSRPAGAALRHIKRSVQTSS